jgi:hypothetical protein
MLCFVKQKIGPERTRNPANPVRLHLLFCAA